MWYMYTVEPYVYRVEPYVYTVEPYVYTVELCSAIKKSESQKEVFREWNGIL